jgi:hypothetical protein
MGGKSPRANESNRPESGGADRNDLREKSGLLEREKEEYAVAQKAKQEESARKQREARDEEGDETAAGPSSPPADA